MAAVVEHRDKGKYFTGDPLGLREEGSGFNPDDPAGIFDKDGGGSRSPVGTGKIFTAEPTAEELQQAREKKELADRLFLRGSGGRSATNPTGGRGDLSDPSLAVKSLLGV